MKTWCEIRRSETSVFSLSVPLTSRRLVPLSAQAAGFLLSLHSVAFSSSRCCSATLQTPKFKSRGNVDTSGKVPRSNCVRGGVVLCAHWTVALFTGFSKRQLVAWQTAIRVTWCRKRCTKRREGWRNTTVVLLLKVIRRCRDSLTQRHTVRVSQLSLHTTHPVTV